MRLRLGMAALILALAGASTSSAAPGLASKVYTPYVKRGVTEVEVRGGRLNGGPLNGEAAAIVEVERGLTDRVSLAVLGEFEHQPGAAAKMESLAIEGVAYLGRVAPLGVDVGAYLEYEQRLHNESGVVEAKLLLARRAGAFQGLLNLIGKQALTDKPGEAVMQYGYAAQATVTVAPNLDVGLQAFGDLAANRALAGPPTHVIGPLVSWETHPSWFPGELALQAAYLVPLGDARRPAPGQARFSVEWERRF